MLLVTSRVLEHLQKGPMVHKRLISASRIKGLSIRTLLINPGPCGLGFRDLPFVANLVSFLEQGPPSEGYVMGDIGR